MDERAERVFLGLGSNLGERALHLRAAVRQIAGIEGVLVRAVSPVYETAPVGLTGQPVFLNAVVEIETTLEPVELLKAVKELERGLGRGSGVRWGPREIDIDILLWGERVIDVDGLRIPHPRLHERRFALAPLADIGPEVIDPESARTVAELAAALEAQGDVVRLDIELSR
ncbi:MAG: 2-amino-4-hydroxy-6-hydroxymethyldihydropteridine diphosphokinase [Candidatus Hydrogenedentota bacterium]